jgi:hypothetical protein
MQLFVCARREVTPLLPYEGKRGLTLDLHDGTRISAGCGLTRETENIGKQLFLQKYRYYQDGWFTIILFTAQHAKGYFTKSILVITIDIVFFPGCSFR